MTDVNTHHGNGDDDTDEHVANDWLGLIANLFENDAVIVGNDEWLGQLGKLFDGTTSLDTSSNTINTLPTTPPADTGWNPEETPPGKSSLLVRYGNRRLDITHLRQGTPDWIGCYVNATSLTISDSVVNDLGFCNSMQHLHTLVADSNTIASLEGSGMLPELHTLSLCNNQITDLDSLLVACSNCFPKLSFLSLLGNACCSAQVTGSTPAQNIAYRIKVSAALPQLKFLDSEAVDVYAKPKTVIAPLKSAVADLKKGNFTRAARNIAKSFINSTEYGAEMTTTGLKGILTTAKATLKAANQVIQADEDDEIATLQATFLPEPISHNGQEQMNKLLRMKKTEIITNEEYTHFIRMNASLQQEISDINRSDAILALERFENNVFPESFQTKELSVDEDLFSKQMREQGLHHVDGKNEIQKLTYKDLPQELDLRTDLQDYPSTPTTPTRPTATMKLPS